MGIDTLPDAAASGSEAQLWKVDLHVHTHFSVDSLAKIHDVLDRARQLGLAKIAITDHNCILGAQIARDKAPELVIVGEEVKTEVGEVIAYFVQEEVPKGLPLSETLDRLEAQGAVISIPHPVDRVRNSALGPHYARQIAARVDAIEVMNSRCLWAADNHRAEILAEEFKTLRTAGSDAHIPQELGLCGLHIPPFESTPESFRQALAEARPFGSIGPYWTHFASKYAKYRKRLLPYDAGEPIVG